MFTNIGGIIKTVAVAGCLILMLASLIAGIIVIAISNNILAGVGLFIVILFLILIGSSITYGFGELIEKVTEIEINTHSKTEIKPVTSNNSILQKTQTQNVVSPANKAIKADTDEPEEWIDMICPVCKEQVSYTKTMLQNDKNLVCPYCNNEFSSQKPDFSK